MHIFVCHFRNQSLKDCHEEIDFQSDVVADISKDADYKYDLNVRHMFHAWEGHKVDDIATYRDHVFTSKFTGTTAQVHHTPFMKAMDDSMECFLNDRSKNSK
jgi:trimethylamine monooxygenase